MQITDLTRDANHVHYRVIDDAGQELRQVDRSLSDEELRRITRSHKSVITVIAETEGVIVSKPTETLTVPHRDIVIDPNQTHTHPEFDEFLRAVPDHPHLEVDHLTARLADLDAYIG